MALSFHSLADVATQLLAAADIDAALRVINDALAQAEKQAGVSLLAYNGRRNTIADRAAKTPPGGTERTQIALDHLPVPVRYALLTGQRFTDVGDQGVQYARLLGVAPDLDDFRLYLKGIVLDGALAGVLAAYDGRRRAGSKLLERLEPLVALFEVTYARFYEREARFEAVSALHDVTSRMRAEHGSAVAGLERELSRLRAARGADVIDHQRVEELQAALEGQRRRAVTAEEQLAMVEQQVVNAVERLERAHVQIHQQSETIQRLEAQLANATPRAAEPGASVPARHSA